MDEQLLKSITVGFNRRTLYPELQACLAQYAEELESMMACIDNAIKMIPGNVEPAPIFKSLTR